MTYDPHASRAARAALRRRIVCAGVDLDRLTEFTDRHFSRPQDIDPHGEQSPRSRSGR